MEKSGGSSFPVTSWSEIHVAGDSRHPRFREFLERICRRYWRPAFEYVRRAGRLAEAEAEDRTQEFFVRLLEKEHLARLDPDRGSFRGFLKRSIQNFLADAAKRSRRVRHGGEVRFLSLDEARVSPVEEEADRAFEEEWARTLMRSALEDLEDRLRCRGLDHYFETFRLYSEPGAGATYEEVARRMRTTVPVVRKRLNKTREELRRIVIERIREYAAGDEDARAEYERLAARFPAGDVRGSGRGSSP